MWFCLLHSRVTAVGITADAGHPSVPNPWLCPCSLRFLHHRRKQTLSSIAVAPAATSVSASDRNVGDDHDLDLDSFFAMLHDPLHVLSVVLLESGRKENLRQRSFPFLFPFFSSAAPADS